MSLLKDFVSGGLPAMLDTPERATTAMDSDGRGVNTQAAPRVYAERYEPAAAGAGSAYPMPSFASVPGGGLTVIAAGFAALVTLVIIAKG